MNWLKIAQLILGEAEAIVPLFIHNPKSQKVEAIIATSVDHVVGTLQEPQTTEKAAPAKA